MNEIYAKTIITRSKNDYWFGTDYNMNIYKGCSHGCIYCDSRSECYGVDQFDRVRVKLDALTIIEKELKKKQKKGVIATGAMSDPYNPFENEYKITREALKLIKTYGFGIAIATKSDLVTRDLDILEEINKTNPVIVKVTITCGSDELSEKIEPNVATTSQRLKAINSLRERGIYTGVLMMPILPFIQDNERNISDIVSLAKSVDANFIYPSFGVTLRGIQRVHFYNKLDEIFSGVKDKYITEYGDQYSCKSKSSKELWKLFSELCDEGNIKYRMRDIIKGYKGRDKNGESRQLSIFD